MTNKKPSIAGHILRVQVHDIKPRTKSTKKGPPLADKSSRAHHWFDFTKEAYKDSDRGCAITMAAFLDAHLQKLLASVLIRAPGVLKRLFEWPGPLSSFSAKIQMAYALRLLHHYEHRDLNRVNKIRNAFAHDLHGLSFKDAMVSDLCYSLEYRREQGLSEDVSARWMYQLTAHGIASDIDNRTLNQDTDRRIRARPVFKKP